MHRVLSIQSHVAFGHAGNSSAVFPLQRTGVDVWPVHTVNFSNQTKYGSWRGPVIDPADVAEQVKGIDERGMLERADALLCGYQGSPQMGAVILEAAELVKQRNPQALFCADPVMGDVDRGFYALPGIPEFMKANVVAKADIMTPNLFELEYLTDRTTSNSTQVLEAAQALREAGPGIVVVTSVVGEDMADDVMRMFAVTGEGAWMVETPKLDRTFHGSGDLTTAMFLAHYLDSRDPAQALSQTASIVFSMLAFTEQLGEFELQLVAGQEQIVAPKHRFEATAI